MSSEAGEGTSTSASPNKEQMDARLKALNLLAQGKRNLICKEVPTAVQQFQDACQLLSVNFGEMAIECAEAYFCYGSALLDLSRMEQDVLGNALEGVDVDADDEGGPNNKDQFEPPDKADDEKEEKMEDTEEGEGDEEGDEEEAEADGAGSRDEGEEGEEDSDDVSNLQLSWEMLDLAKLIYSKDPSKESQLRAAEAHLKLGEVSLETEQYEQAISDLESCLEMQKKHLDPCDRAIAETYYQLGLACQLNKELDKAKDCFSSAVTCLETKMEKLKTVVEEKPPKSPSQFVEPAERAESEIKEILEILPEIKEKITDVEEESKTMASLKLMAKQAMGSIFSAAADSTTETGFGAGCSSPIKSTEPQKTSDITHLIRKKRKPEEEKKEEEEDLENKKQKHEGGSGDADMNGICEKKENTSEAVAAT